MNFKDSKNYKDFLELYTQTPDRVVFFVGAGLSMPLFSSWAVFLKELVDITDSKGKFSFDKNELLNKIDSGIDFLEIADYCAKAIGKNEYRDVIEKHFDKEFDIEDIPLAYQKLLLLQFKSIITTNYDRIPEVGGKGKLGCYTNKNVPEALRALERGKKIVLKIHGDVLNQESIVLTETEFNSIIHNNTLVQNGLRSLFSTSTVCFIGFGLTDPHFKLILGYLNSINDGKAITHYAFLTSKTQFEIDALEKKYGLRIIEYAPADQSHPEVVEFINELSGIKSFAKTEKDIDSEDELFSLIESKLQVDVGIQHYYLEFSKTDKRLIINHLTRAHSEYEQQKEILSIYKIFDFKTKIVKYIQTSCFFQTEPSIEYIKSSPLILVSKCSYDDSFQFSINKVTKSVFWNKLEFNQPFMIGNIHFTDREVQFPFMNY